MTLEPRDFELMHFAAVTAAAYNMAQAGQATRQANVRQATEKEFAAFHFDQLAALLKAKGSASVARLDQVQMQLVIAALREAHDAMNILAKENAKDSWRAGQQRAIAGKCYQLQGRLAEAFSHA